MIGFVSPNVGGWYKNRENGELFEVVAADDTDQNVEVQFFSGEIEGIDLDTWKQMDLVLIPAPEDWSGPFEMSREDLDMTDDTLHPENWSGALADLEPEDLY